MAVWTDTKQIVKLVVEAPGASGAFLLCAEHVRQLGGASPLPNPMEVKG
jgi:hypothetical protein